MEGDVVQNDGTMTASNNDKAGVDGDRSGGGGTAAWMALLVGLVCRPLLSLEESALSLVNHTLHDILIRMLSIQASLANAAMQMV